MSLTCVQKQGLLNCGNLKRRLFSQSPEGGKDM